MALIICPECTGKVSDKAEVCPHCGYPMSEEVKTIKVYSLMYDKETNNLRQFVSAAIKILHVSDPDEWNSFFDKVKNDKPILQGLTLDDANMFIQRFKQENIILMAIDEGEISEKEIIIEHDMEDEFTTCPKCSATFLYSIDHCTHCGYATQKYKDRIKSISVEVQSKNVSLQLPKCPMCGSTNIQKISSLSRASSIIGFGILSKKIGKQWQCNNPKCKHLW